jgi:hypothetical protein
MNEMDEIEQIAKTCHEVNRAYCAAIGDGSQVPWVDAPEWQRHAALMHVRQMLAAPTMTPRQSHEAWLATKQADGWTYGPVKNASQKEHPCCLAYDDLPPAQQAKDALLVAVVHSFLPD